MKYLVLGIIFEVIVSWQIQKTREVSLSEHPDNHVNARSNLPGRLKYSLNPTENWQTKEMMNRNGKWNRCRIYCSEKVVWKILK